MARFGFGSGRLNKKPNETVYLINKWRIPNAIINTRIIVLESLCRECDPCFLLSDRRELGDAEKVVSRVNQREKCDDCVHSCIHQ